MPLNEEKITIGFVERETGLSKDLLRTWERRYGFPTPVRTVNDEREYTESDLVRLKTIKKLLDNGMRPGKIISLPIAELEALASCLVQQKLAGDTVAINQAISFLKNNELESFTSYLTGILIAKGLKHFILEVVSPMNHAIGDAWFRGEINVFHEHCYSAILELVFGRAQTFLSSNRQPPRIILTTLSGEQHHLGLLMARAIMLFEDADAFFIGSQLPNSEIVAAVKQFSADIIALSFSPYFTIKRAHRALETLRQELPDSVAIWAGGGQIKELASLHPDISFFSSLDEIPCALSDWRSAHS